MFAICTHVDVADSRHQSRALDTLQSASSRTILGARNYLESLAFYASMGWDFNLDFCYRSSDVRYFHCDHCKCTTKR
jgi:hypothetical protein